ncbi:MAG TPA: methylmalonyl Co-A mutase-associated GTPase MeaB [Candidatus Dormibacteraeota bacterium]|jgi:LAO/AO transport system kinase|nr:methylmalonyl Co-A mutase-associated GTPase MeaB [Candidatus Dormibacteraeota bacterium]
MDLAQRLLAGDVRALARAIRLVEDRDPAVEELLREVRGRAGRAHVVGITGPPGGGKSTLADGLIERWRKDGHTVGVIAVDPSSPFSGGAILGDRVRMQRHALDPGVYIRSMAARGHLGGLASAAREAVRLIDASGRDRCLLETVGVGQSELEVMQTADSTIVVTTPAAGDSVQIIKAGIMEIADIFVVNKADISGADRIAKELRRMVHETKSGSYWEPPVVMTVASSGEGLDELAGAVERHKLRLEESGELARRRAGRLRAEVEAIVVEKAQERARRALSRGTIASEVDGDLSRVDPYALAEKILTG